MRLDEKDEKTAEDLINSLNEDELYEIFAKNAEEINSRAIAQAIVGARRLRKLLTVGDLTRLIDKVVGRKDTKVYSRVFQALRMEVNQELENLKKGLIGATKIIGSHGRIAIITFHSVEDRLVKRFIKENKFKEEIKSRGDRTKSYERSATLRIFKK
jgi:16S rRNA (cytosine1402-N4)-methyltransferase